MTDGDENIDVRYDAVVFVGEYDGKVEILIEVEDRVGTTFILSPLPSTELACEIAEEILKPEMTVCRIDELGFEIF